MGISTRVLAVLENVRPGRLSASILLAELRIIAGRCGESELNDALRNLEDAKLILRHVDLLTGDSFYEITKAGAKRLKGGLGA